MTSPPVSGIDAQVETATSVIVAWGHFPDGLAPESTGISLRPVLESEAPKLEQAGTKTMAADGIITVTPPPPPPPIYAEETRTVDRQAQTTDATAVTVGTFTLHTLTGYAIGVEVQAMADNGVMLHAQYSVVAKRLNQAAVKVGTEAVIARVQDSQATGWVVAFAASGNALVMTVQGVVGRTIDWLVSARIVSFTPQGRAPGTD
ncbi:MAG TPA: hypothetical protein VF076_07110 [Acidimicrobiales bacterium]